MNAKKVKEELGQMANPSIAEHSQRFFKTGKGEYGEGDRFLGIRVPKIRAVAKKSTHLENQEVLSLLRSPFHEERLCALLILTYQYPKADQNSQGEICRLYLENTEYINNWDLVDSSAHKILGPWLMNGEKRVLYRLVRSESLWERRIAVITTLYFICRRQFEDTLRLSEILLDDPEDLIHKAVGWMLREVGKRCPQTERVFLNRHFRQMPRTMLRYAIEKFPKEERERYMAKQPT